jgi:hypothetical protein
MVGRASRPLTDDVYVATESGVVKVKGRIYRYIKGQTRVRAGHPLLRALPERFAPLQLDYELPSAVVSTTPLET